MRTHSWVRRRLAPATGKYAEPGFGAPVYSRPYQAYFLKDSAKRIRARACAQIHSGSGLAACYPVHPAHALQTGEFAARKSKVRPLSCEPSPVETAEMWKSAKVLAVLQRLE